MRKQVHLLTPKHHLHLAHIGIPWLRPPHIRCTQDEYDRAYKAWKASSPEQSHEFLHMKTLGHIAWAQHQDEQRKQLVPESMLRKELRIIAWLLGIAILILVTPRAHCQFSHINNVVTKSGGSPIGFHSSPFTINCSTNTACTDDGTTLNITASSTAATAWSAITAATNSNAGTFAMSGNTLDLTAATLVKLRIASGLTTSVNGDLGYDSGAAARWHIWQGGADRLLIASTNVGVAGQAFLSNADGSGAFADPIVSGPDAPGVAPTKNPVQIGLFDGTNVQRVLGSAAGRLSVDVNTAPTTTVTGTVTANAGSGNFASTVADGANTTLGAKADAKSTATDTTAVTIMQVLKEISAMEQAPASRAVTNAGTFAVQEATLDGAISSNKLATKSADGDFVTLGTKTDAADTHTDATSVSVVSVLKEISAKAQAPASTPVTGTFFQATQPVSCANGATCPVNATLQTGSNTIGSAKVTDGTNTLQIDPCQSTAKSYFSKSGTADVVLIAGTSAKKTYLCSLVIVVGAAQNLNIVEGTGSTCGTGIAAYPGGPGGTTAATGWNLAANGGLTYGNGASALSQATTNADDVCAKLANAVQTNISGSYVQQ